MSLSNVLAERASAKCELCAMESTLTAFPLLENATMESEQIALCRSCSNQLELPPIGHEEADYWRCLNNTMWSEHLPVKAAIWSILNHHKEAVWPVDLLDMMYLTDEELAFTKSVAQCIFPHKPDDDAVIHKDANGVILQSGDTVVITKDLEVKGASLTAKRGTAVRNISLVYDNAAQIEGRVDGQQIVILTKFVKKAK